MSKVVEAARQFKPGRDFEWMLHVKYPNCEDRCLRKFEQQKQRVAS